MARNKRAPSTDGEVEYTTEEQQTVDQRQSSQSKSNSFTFNCGSSSSISIWQTMDKYGSVSFQESDGRQHSVIKNAQGQLIFGSAFSEI